MPSSAPPFEAAERVSGVAAEELARAALSAIIAAGFELQPPSANDNPMAGA